MNSRLKLASTKKMTEKNWKLSWPALTKVRPRQIVLIVTGVLVAACATHQESRRPIPQIIERSCSALSEKILFAMNGSKLFKARPCSMTPKFRPSMCTPRLLRHILLESRLPAPWAFDWVFSNGMPIGFCFIRSLHVAYRFPTSELGKDTLRRERFFRYCRSRLHPNSFLMPC